MKRTVAVFAMVLAGSAALSLSADAASIVSVTSGNFWFEDATVGDGQIVISAGDQLRVEVVDGTQHTVDIAEFGIASGKMATGDVFVTPPLNTPGTYTLFCRTHLNRGHKTTLIIRGQATTTTTTAATTTTTSTTTTTTAPATTTTTAPPTPTTSSTTGTSGVTTTTTSTVAGAEVAPVSGDQPRGPGEAGSVDLSIEAGASPLTEPNNAGETNLDTPDTTVVAGMVARDGAPVWTRSVWVGLLALIPLALLTFVAVKTSET
jgi:plastocyanin